MILEALILPLIANVLGDYISSAGTRRAVQKTRAEMEVLIGQRLAAIDQVHNDVQALKIAMRELDVVVKGAPVLAWQGGDGVLVVSPRSSKLRKPQINPQEALAQLQSTVDSRRRELGLPEIVSTEPEPEPKSEPKSEPEPEPVAAGNGSGEPETLEPEVSPPDLGAGQASTPAMAVLVPPPEHTTGNTSVNSWRDRVITLQHGVSEERRRRMKEGGASDVRPEEIH